MARRWFWPMLLFGLIGVVYAMLTQPGYSWIAFGIDHFEFVRSIDDFQLAHSTGFPLYVMTGWLLTHVFPFGHIAWRAAFFMSTIPAILTAVAIFFAVRKQTKNVYAPYVGALTYAGAGIVMAQAMIVEVYAFGALFVALAYLALVYQRWPLAALAIGLGMGVHTMSVVAGMTFVIFWFKDLKRYLWLALVAAAAPYLALPFMARPDMLTIGGQGLADWFSYFAVNLIYVKDSSLPLSMVPERLPVIIGLLISSLGLALIPIVLHLTHKKTPWKLRLLILPLFLMPVTSIFNDAMAWLPFAFVFLAVAAGLGMELVRLPKVLIPASGIALLLAGSVGFAPTNVDPDRTAQGFYEQLSDIPGNAIVYSAIVTSEGEPKGDFRTFLGQQWYLDSTSATWASVSPRRYHSDAVKSGYVNLGTWERERLQSRYGIQTPVEPLCERCTPWERDQAVMRAVTQANPERPAYYWLLAKPETYGLELKRWE